MKLSTTSILTLGFVSRAIAWHHATSAMLREALRSQDGDYILVAFVLPDHQPSQALEREWLAIQETETDGRTVSIDCSAEPSVCKEHDVASFPAIRLYHDQGKRVDRYRGPRTAAHIRSFVARARRPALSIVTENNLTSFRAIDDVVFVFKMNPQEQVPEAHEQSLDVLFWSAFEAQAKRCRDRYSFGLMFRKGQKATATCYNNVNGAEMTLDDFDTGSINTLVKRCSAPLIPELTRGNEMEYGSKGKSFVHYFVGSPEERDEYVRDMMPLARKYQEFLQFTTIDVSEYPEMLPVYGQRSGLRGVLSVYHPSNGQVFPHPGTGKISAAVVEQFLLDIIDGKVKPWSGEVPPEGDGGHEEL